MCEGLPEPAADAIKEDTVRHLENRKMYEDIYDPWSDESPAGMSQQATNEIREWLKKGGDA